ncbi:YcxB family protein [Nocardia inohanensis]|uniref:YcxB family protein n=1 Tax=Nocardia inohanensis TaxID=209246 RepID=UPI000834963E|nr:YcxB family protein [Nocardia inohanensis]
MLHSPIETSVVATPDLGRRLSRATLPMMLRSPLTWGFVLIVPLILMFQHIIDVIGNTSKSGSGLAGIAGIYFGLLLVTVVLFALVTALRVVRPPKQITAYAAAGRTISARYQQDSVDFILDTGTTHLSYTEIDELIDLGDVVYVRYGTLKGLALPREIFTAEALAAMGRELSPR